MGIFGAQRGDRTLNLAWAKDFKSLMYTNSNIWAFGTPSEIRTLRETRFELVASAVAPTEYGAEEEIRTLRPLVLSQRCLPLQHFCIFWCPRQDLNLHNISAIAISRLRVYLFHHKGILVPSDGVAPPESEDNGFTDRSAPTYSITWHFGGLDCARISF